ncbi:YccF family protein [Rhizobium sp. FKL33]|uniref:YccF family protein n=1 Tax=Rhizobium sp. FKL33 TaxID=2562307 RepID=UPI0010C108C2|nr:YccF family protein [Rhizobium sp. FKL33]
MRFAGNVIWFVFGGAITGLIWLVGALVFAISIVGLPLTRSAIEMAKLSAWPFGKDVVHIRELDQKDSGAAGIAIGTVAFLFNILWACTFGLALFIYYLIAGCMFCITLIGIPFGLQCFKLAGISLWPIGRRVVPREVADLARSENAAKSLARYRG